ncbi:MAG: type II secretion system F family protein [bacterium]|jgi:tight adherence protein B
MRELILIITFIGSLFVAYDVVALAGFRSGAVRQRVLDVARQRNGVTAEPIPRVTKVIKKFEIDRRKWVYASRLEEIVTAFLARYNIAANLAEKLRRADLRYRVSEFLIVIAGCTVAASLLGFLLGRSALAAFLFLPLGVLVPVQYLNHKVEKRGRLFINQLPDAISIISNALKSGYSFLQSVDMVSGELPAPVSQEFAQVVKECRLNVSLEDALGNMLQRVNSRDLEMMVTAILIQREVGGNLAEVLDNINTTIRDRLRILGEVRTLTAQGKISGIVIACIPAVLAFLLYTINPSYMRPLFIHPLGQALLGTAVVMQIIGLNIIRRIINIEV